MNRSTRSAALLVAALTASTLAFAPATTAPAASASDADLAAVTVVDGRPVAAVRGLSTRTGFAPDESPTDLVSWVRASRRVAEAAGLRTFAATDACAPLSPTAAGVATDCDEPVPSEDGEDGSEEFSFSYIDTAGDLDGDGWDDVLEITVRFGSDDTTETTTARSGVDGAELWTLASTDGFDGGSYLTSAPDLDGDGADDLLRVAFSYSDDGEGSCTPLGCEFRDSFSETVTMTALRGATGEALGSTTLETSATYEDGGTFLGEGPASAAVFDQATQVTGGVTGFDFVDLDGDGAHTLLLGTVDIDSRSEGVQVGAAPGDDFDDAILEQRSVEAASTVTLADLVTGERTTVSEDDGVVGYPVGATLDGRDTIVLDRYPLGGSQQLSGCVFSDTLGVYDCTSSDAVTGDDEAPTRELLAGDLTTVWTAAADPFSLVVEEAGGDLDGDGSDDLLDIVVDLEVFELATSAVSGASGAVLWTAPVAGGVVDDGDLLSVAFDVDEQFDPEGYDATVTAIGTRLDGATGAVAAESPLASIEVFERDGEFQDGFLSVSPAQLDGDGIDLATIAETYLLAEGETEEFCYEEEDPDTGETFEYCETYVSYELVDQSGVVAGHDGAALAPLFARDLAGSYLAGLVDVDLDGRDDLLVETVDLDEGIATTTVAERTDGTAIWTLTSAFVTAVLDTPTGSSLVTFDLESGDTVVRDALDLVERWRVAGGGVFEVVVVVLEAVS